MSSSRGGPVVAIVPKKGACARWCVMRMLSSGLARVGEETQFLFHKTAQNNDTLAASHDGIDDADVVRLRRGLLLFGEDFEALVSPEFLARG